MLNPLLLIQSRLSQLTPENWFTLVVHELDFVKRRIKNVLGIDSTSVCDLLLYGKEPFMDPIKSLSLGSGNAAQEIPISFCHFSAEENILTICGKRNDNNNEKVCFRFHETEENLEVYAVTERSLGCDGKSYQSKLESGILNAHCNEEGDSKGDGKFWKQI